MATSTLLIPLLLFGGGAVVALIISGIMRSWPWGIAITGSLVLMAIIVAGLLGTVVLAPTAQVKTPFPPARVAQQKNATEPNGVHWDVNQGVQQFHVYDGGQVAVNSGVSVRGVLMVVVLVGFLVVIVFRRLMFHGAVLAHPRVWPFLFAISVIIIFLWINLRFQSSRTNTASVVTPQGYPA